jgi:hypothetical protein
MEICFTFFRFFHIFIKYKEQVGMNPLRPSVQNMSKEGGKVHCQLLVSFNKSNV